MMSGSNPFRPKKPPVSSTTSNDRDSPQINPRNYENKGASFDAVPARVRSTDGEDRIINPILSPLCSFILCY